MNDGLSYSRLVTFSDGAPSGAVTWVLRDLAGTTITTGSVTPSVGAVSVLITVDATHNTRSPTDPLRITRKLSWSYTTGGQTRAGVETYFVEGGLPFPATPSGVRNLIGFPDHNLPDSEISLVEAYWQVQGLAGEASLATYEGQDGPASTKIARAIEASAALSLFSSLPLRLADKESSGTDSYTRSKADWEALRRDLQTKVDDALAMIANDDLRETGDIFVLTQPVDRWGAEN